MRQLIQRTHTHSTECIHLLRRSLFQEEVDCSRRNESLALASREADDGAFTLDHLDTFLCIYANGKM
eukprot:7391570-Prymnesium_polylepis.5